MARQKEKLIQTNKCQSCIPLKSNVAVYSEMFYEIQKKELGYIRYKVKSFGKNEFCIEIWNKQKLYIKNKISLATKETLILFIKNWKPGGIEMTKFIEIENGIETKEKIINLDLVENIDIVDANPPSIPNYCIVFNFPGNKKVTWEYSVKTDMDNNLERILLFNINVNYKK